MSEWKEFSILDFAEVQNYKRIPLSSMERAKKKGCFPYYGASGIIDYVDDYIFDGKYVLISEDGENLKSRQTPIAFEASGQFWVNNHAHILKGKKDFHNKLIVYYFLNLDLNSYLTGAVQPKLNKESLLSIPMLLPINEELQKSIVEVLSSLDDKIALLHRQNKTLEQLAETLFRQWFVEEVGEHRKIGVLGDVMELNYGKTLRDQERSGVGFPVYGSNGIVGYHSEFFVEGPGIITGRKGTLGVINYSFDNFYPIDTTFYITSKIDSRGLFYEYFLLKTLNLFEMNSDSAVPGLNRTLAHGMQIKISPHRLVSEFNEVVKPHFQKIKSNTIQIRTLTELRDTLLPKLMSGEVGAN